MNFDQWVGLVCYTPPTAEAYNLAKAAWKYSAAAMRRACAQKCDEQALQPECPESAAYCAESIRAINLLQIDGGRPVIASPVVGRGDTVQHLRPYGYAPGDYMSRCHVCEELMEGVDKRAVTCRPCAESLHSEARTKASEIVP